MRQTSSLLPASAWVERRADSTAPEAVSERVAAFSQAGGGYSPRLFALAIVVSAVCGAAVTATRGGYAPRPLTPDLALDASTADEPTTKTTTKSRFKLDNLGQQNWSDIEASHQASARVRHRKGDAVGPLEAAEDEDELVEMKIDLARHSFLLLMEAVFLLLCPSQLVCHCEQQQPSSPNQKSRAIPPAAHAPGRAGAPRRERRDREDARPLPAARDAAALPAERGGGRAQRRQRRARRRDDVRPRVPRRRLGGFGRRRVHDVVSDHRQLHGRAARRAAERHHQRLVAAPLQRTQGVCVCVCVCVLAFGVW